MAEIMDLEPMDIEHWLSIYDTKYSRLKVGPCK